MRGSEFLNKMDLISPQHIHAADIQPRTKRTGLKNGVP